MEILHFFPPSLLIYWATTKCQTLCWEAETKRKQTGPDLSAVTGAGVGEIDFSTEALIKEREQWILLEEMGMNNNYGREIALELG